MKIIGHRGARGLAPENTIASFRRALEASVDGVEFDVRVTKDGQAVLLHDPYVIDDQDKRHVIAQLTLQEVRSIKPDIALFADAIRLVNRQVPMMVEVKPREQIEPIVAVIKDFLHQGWQPADFSIASFSQKTLMGLHRALPNLTPIVISHFCGTRAAWRARRLGTKHISMSRHALWFGYIWIMRRRGYHLYTFTLNNPAKARTWHKYGLDNVITDRPDWFVEDH